MFPFQVGHAVNALFDFTARHCPSFEIMSAYPSDCRNLFSITGVMIQFHSEMQPRQHPFSDTCPAWQHCHCGGCSFPLFPLDLPREIHCPRGRMVPSAGTGLDQVLKIYRPYRHTKAKIKRLCCCLRILTYIRPAFTLTTPSNINSTSCIHHQS